VLASVLAAAGVPGLAPSAALGSSSSAPTWTRLYPANSPVGREDASMAYDAATGNVVLTGGYTGSSTLRDTWVWNGSTWAKQHPAASPPAEAGAAIAYDAATSTVVLFGGQGRGGGALGGTWTWDGTTWIQQHPATHPHATGAPQMAYDAATGNVVLFGGNYGFHIPHDTWTWG
jgi:hypothetical protein